LPATDPAAGIEASDGTFWIVDRPPGEYVVTAVARHLFCPDNPVSIRGGEMFTTLICTAVPPTTSLSPGTHLAAAWALHHERRWHNDASRGNGYSMCLLEDESSLLTLSTGALRQLIPTRRIPAFVIIAICRTLEVNVSAGPSRGQFARE
jgi:hypothetical protein